MEHGPYRAGIASAQARCLLCSSQGAPSTTCETCMVARPSLAEPPPRAFACPRCAKALIAVDIGAGATIHACVACRSTFYPARAWARLFDERALAAEIEARFPRGQAEQGIRPFVRCPFCPREMERVRFAATSDIVIDACEGGDGIWLYNGALTRILAHADYRGRVGVEAAIEAADDAWFRANGIDRAAYEAHNERMRREVDAWAERAADAEEDAAFVRSLMIRGIGR